MLQLNNLFFHVQHKHAMFGITTSWDFACDPASLALRGANHARLSTTQCTVMHFQTVTIHCG